MIPTLILSNADLWGDMGQIALVKPGGAAPAVGLEVQPTQSPPRDDMESSEYDDLQRKIEMMFGRLMASETMIRLLMSTHPNQAVLAQSLKHCEPNIRQQAPVAGQAFADQMEEWQEWLFQMQQLRDRTSDS